MCFNDTADQILSGGIDNEVKVSKIALVVVMFSFPTRRQRLKDSTEGFKIIEITLHSHQLIVSLSPSSGKGKRI